MALKIGDVVRLKAGGASMTVSKFFKSPEGREMVQCTWFDKPREHRAAFVIDSLEATEGATLASDNGSTPDCLGGEANFSVGLGVRARASQRSPSIAQGDAMHSSNCSALRVLLRFVLERHVQ
jgi:uncharacterized protein YodC (DUF2158 family)